MRDEKIPYQVVAKTAYKPKLFTKYTPPWFAANFALIALVLLLSSFLWLAAHGTQVESCNGDDLRPQTAARGVFWDPFAGGDFPLHRRPNGDSSTRKPSFSTLSRAE